MAGADLIVAGSPLLGFSLPTEAMLKNIASGAAKDPTPPDLSHPGMRIWLDALPPGHARVAAFETRNLVVTGQRGQGDPQAVGGAWLQCPRFGAEIHSRGKIRSVARRRVGAGQSMGRGAGTSNGANGAGRHVMAASKEKPGTPGERTTSLTRFWSNKGGQDVATFV